MAVVEITNSRADGTLLRSLMKIALDQNRPVTLVEFVRLAFEAGYRPDSECFAYLIMAALQTLVRRGILIKYTVQSHDMCNKITVYTISHYTENSRG